MFLLGIALCHDVSGSHGSAAMRTLFLATAMVLVVAGANAQTSSSSTTSSSTPSPMTSPSQPSTVGSAAPVGHRQPRMSDLPSDMADKQKSGTDGVMARRAEDEFDQ